MDSNNRPERIDPVDLIGTHYEAVEMSDTYRLTIQNQTRAVVASRQRLPMMRWAVGLASAVAVAAVAVLCLHFAAVAPVDKGAGPVKHGMARVNKAKRGGAGQNSGPKLAKKPAVKAPVHVPESVPQHSKPLHIVKRNGSPAVPKTAPKRGEPMVVAISVQGPVKTGSGKVLAAGERVRAGDTIRTGKGGRVTLVTRKGSEFDLDSNSQIVLTASNIATIERGRLYCSNRDKEIARIDTPAGRVRLLGTVVDTNVVRKDTVAVTVVEGKVELSNRHGNAMVDAGKRSVLVAYCPPQAGSAVDTYRETAWYQGRRDYVSDYGDVVYTVAREDPANLMTEIWACNADGSNKHRVSTFLGFPQELGPWLPGTRWLSITTNSVILWKLDFVRRRATWINGTSMVGEQDWFLDAATGQTQPFNLPAGYHVVERSFSSDGMSMAFSGYYRPDPNERNKIETGAFVYSRSAGTVTKDLHGSVQYAPAWAPDSRRIVVSRSNEPNRTGQGDYGQRFGLVIVDTETGEVQDLGIYGTGACFSPDGKRMAYCGESDDDSWFYGSPKAGRIFVLHLTPGAKPIPISSASKDTAWPCWSPDGTRIAYRDNEGLYVVGADGAGLKKIYPAKDVRKIAWAPSGDAIYASISVKGGQSRLVIIPTDGSGRSVDLALDKGGSQLPPDAAAQTSAAASAFQEAIFRYAVGFTHQFEGDPAATRETFRSAANLFAGLVWDYPLSGLTAEDTLRYADASARQAAASDEKILADGCQQRFDCLRGLLFRAVVLGEELPKDLSPLRALTLPDGFWMSSWAWPNTDRKHIQMIFECPGAPGGGPERYVYAPPLPGSEPKVGDVILQCRIHPSEKWVWDEHTDELWHSKRQKTAGGKN